MVDRRSPRLRWGYGTGPARRPPARRARRRVHRSRPRHPGVPAGPGAPSRARAEPRNRAPALHRRTRPPRRSAHRPRLSPEPLRVAVDSTSLIGARTGVGTFTAELLSGLAGRADLEVTAFAVTRRGAGAMAAELPAGVHAVRRPMVARPLRWCWMRSDRPPVEWWTGAVDVVHGPNFVVPPAHRAAEVVTVHDLTCVRFPELCTPDVLQVPDAAAPGDRTGRVDPHRVRVRRRRGDRRVRSGSVDGSCAVANGAPDLVDPPTGDPPWPPKVVGRPGPSATCSPSAPSSPARTSRRSCGPSTQLAADDPDLHLVLAGPDGWGSDAVTAAIAGRPPRRTGPAARAGCRPTARLALLAGAVGDGLSVAVRGLRSPAPRGAGRRHAGRGHPGRCAARGAGRRRRVGRPSATPRSVADALRRVLADPARGATRSSPPGPGVWRPTRGTAPPTGSSTSTDGPPRPAEPDAAPTRTYGTRASGRCPKLAAPAPALGRGPTSGTHVTHEGARHRLRRVRRTAPVRAPRGPR